ncbi:MAG TPA: hypothetical protein IAC36_01890 [Candidatus Aphodomonas merdavium]|nr:hypothetical protein [Candidatus Aphodomonas merdavium]
MRCGCPDCGAYMIQSESLELACVCPECGYRCNACMGTNTVVSREQLRQQAQRIAEMEEASREHEGRI